MATYQELQAQLAELTGKAEEARAAEVHAVIEGIRAKVAEYGLTEKDIFGRRRRGQQAKKASTAAPKYRDPKTRAEWSGHGRPPAWIKDAKDRSRFLIAGTTVEATVAASKPTKKAATKKAAVATENVAGSNAKTTKKAAAKKAASKKAIAKKAARPATTKTAAAKKRAGRKAAAATNVVAETDVAAAPESDAV